jgi:hypothetical protein
MRGCWKREGTVASVLPLIASWMILLAGTSDPSHWQIKLVDQTGVGKFSSLKIDREGNVHVAYVAEDESLSLKYAFWDHVLKRWFVMTVARSASFCSLALDSKQNPHIAYADFGTASGSKLRHASWDGTSWKQQAIPLDSDSIAYYTSIVVDTHDNPSISFYEYVGARGTDFKIRLRSVSWNGQYWQVQTIDGQQGSGKFNSMAIDAQDHIHLAYANVAAGTASLRYAAWDGHSWNREIVDGPEQNKGDSVGYSVCIALDKDGNPHIVYMNESSSQVKYAVRKGGRWEIQVVDDVAQIGYPDRNSIAVDEQGQPYIGYYDARRGILKVAHRQGQKWSTEVVDSNFTGYTSSLQIHAGTLWISYADEANGGLKVAQADVGSRDPSAASEAAKPVLSKTERRDTH